MSECVSPVRVGGWWVVCGCGCECGCECGWWDRVGVVCCGLYFFFFFFFPAFLSFSSSSHSSTLVIVAVCVHAVVPLTRFSFCVWWLVRGFLRGSSRSGHALTGFLPGCEHCC